MTAPTPSQPAFDEFVADILSLPPDPFTLQEMRRGLPVDLLDRMAASLELSPVALARALGISERTLGRRRDAPEARLTPAESDRLEHAHDVIQMAVEAFEGRRDEAVRWLTTPKAALDDQAPLELLDTRFNTRLVEQMLISMTYLMPV